MSRYGIYDQKLGFISDEDCPERPLNPQTNADRIRAMSDEELAILFAKLKAKPNVLDRMVQSYSGRDVNEWYDWLKQEATE